MQETPDTPSVLTRVGPGTPMGEMMRRYWHPIAASSELPYPDCDPLRTRMLGEDFVVFRDSSGKVGVLDEHCMHRGVSLALGRVEDGGITCIYHGWRFAVDGTLLATPNHADPAYLRRHKARSYPVREQSGLIWAYIGPPEKQPPFRRFAFDDVPEQNRYVIRVNVKANYLQLWEGGADTSHVGILHSNLTRPGWAMRQGQELPKVRDMLAPAWDNMAPKLEIEDTPFGFHYAGLRRLPGEGAPRYNARVVPIFLPTGRVIAFADFFSTVFETPNDDESTSTYLVEASPVRPMSRADRLVRSGLTSERVYRDSNFLSDWSDRFGQDRAAMRERRSWSGLHGLTQEDAVMSLSMGPIRKSREHLVPADAAIVRLRRRLQASMELHARGLDPLGLMCEDMRPMQSKDLELQEGQRWQECVPEHQHRFAPSLAAAARPEREEEAR